MTSWDLCNFFFVNGLYFFDYFNMLMDMKLQISEINKKQPDSLMFSKTGNFL